MMRAVNRSRAASVFSMQAPMGGWNTRDPLANMPETDAARLTNLIPDTNGVRLREGYTRLCAAGTSPVDFLKSFPTAYGARLIAASSNSLYDATSGTASLIKSGFMSDQWNSIVMNGRLGMVNGVDDPIYLDYAPATGIRRVSMSMTGPATPALMKIIHLHKSRSYFATGDEPAFWYSAVGALGGTMTRFPLDRVARTGGNVIDMKSWTVDGGSGPDDYFVIFLDSGETIVYQGDNPGDSTAWSLVGRYSAGRVIASIEFAGSIHAVTPFDYNVFPDDFQTEGIRAASKLTGAAKDAVKAKGGLSRWQIFFAPLKGLKIVNVPQNEGASYQHVTNLDTGSHCLFTGLNATIWETHNERTYFGDFSGNINQLTGDHDNGSAISWEIVTAPNRLGSHYAKDVLEYRSVISGEGTLTETTALGYDYNLPDTVSTTTISPQGTPWNTSPWDTSEWTESAATKGDWVVAGGQGQTVQYYSRGSVKGFRPTWNSVDFFYELSDLH